MTNPMSSVPNLRDLGGIATAQGRVVARGRLFRSSHFGAVAPRDAARLQALALRTVVDLRGVGERAAAPWCLGGGVEHVHLPIEPTAVAAMQDLQQAGTDDEAPFVDVMHRVYRSFVHQRSPVFATLLQRLLVADGYPLVFHCTAGKDRTGFAAALVLLALDVPEATIVKDFLLSNERWVWTAASEPAGPAWTVLSRVRAEYLETSFDAMRQGWGSTGAYLAQALGMHDSARARLAGLLLD